MPRGIFLTRPGNGNSSRNLRSSNILRSEEDSENWEQLTNEKIIRRMLLKTKGMTEKLVDSVIFAVVRVRKVNKNRVALGPILGKDGSIHCVICNNFPVVCAVIIPADAGENTTGLEQEDKDLSFVSFTCDWHAINPKVAESEIRCQNVWSRLLELQRRYEKEEDELN
jgi:hypothetical protein